LARSMPTTRYPRLYRCVAWFCAREADATATSASSAPEKVTQP